VVLQTVALPEDGAALRLLRESGMNAVRYSWQMEIELAEASPVPDWPEGVSVRTMRSGDSRAIYEARSAAFKDHWGVVEEPFEEGFALWQHRMEKGPNFDSSLWFLAETSERIVGFSLCTSKSPEDPNMGWIDLLGVLRSWRRRGLGLALLLYSLSALRRRGLSRAGLFVDAESLTGATRLYERAGMKATQRYVTFEKELRPGRDLSRQSA
jgi:mycothiol synthase